MPDTPEFVVELRSIAKSFGSCVANADIHLQLKRGSIHAVIGENGAGKSTAMKILYGLMAPDAGEILIRGKACSWNSPQAAIAHGIGMVQQHFLLSEVHGALDNILLARAAALPSTAVLDRAAALRELQELAATYGLTIDWSRPVGEIPVALQQQIEILKLLYARADILILDEPTAVLTPLECRVFFTQLRRLAAEGRSILIITHKLHEVMELADEVTVFRAGRIVGHRQIQDTNAEDLAELMIGRRFPPHDKPATDSRARRSLLKFSGVNLQRREVSVLRDLSFEVFSGEIVGVAGVHGNGQSELLQMLLSPQEWLRLPAAKRGHWTLLGRSPGPRALPWQRPAKLGFIPEDRHRDGLLLDAPQLDNFLLGLQRSSRFGRGGWILRKPLREQFAAMARDFEVRGAAPALPARSLSGGNQQKLIVARELVREPELIVAAEPTRGVDLGAMHFLHEKFLAARARGAGILLVSSDLDEILTLSDRILVMSKGAVTREFKRGECDDRALGLAMGGDVVPVESRV
ncbi:MAG: ABC transporter ATP-binding protein [Bdellovibrionales bacterium]|nr:ABC transporter ATP-binding protein [Bdellovibrionales bacterium]